MRDAASVRRLLRAAHPDLLRTALLLAGDRAAADALVERAVLHVLRHGRRTGLTADAVRDAMAHAYDSGRTPAGGGQLIDAMPAADDDLRALADALRDLTPAERTVTVLRLTEGLSVEQVAGVLQASPAEVGASERSATARLRGTVDGRTPLSEALEELAAVPPDAAAPERAADAVLARRRRRRIGVAAVAAAALAAVPLGLALSDGAPGRPTDGEARRSVDVLVGPARGSLADDAEFLAGAGRLPWGTGDDPPAADRRVVFAADTAAGRVALVVAETPGGFDGAWLTGPPGAAPRELTPWVPERLGRTRPATLLVESAATAAVVVVAAPGDTVYVSPRLVVEPDGEVRRDFAGVPADDGTAVVEVADGAAGRAAAVAVVRADRVVHRSGVVGPDDAGTVVLPDLQPLRPGTAPVDDALVAEAARRMARPLGVAATELDLDLLWSAELTRTGGLGSVVVVTGRTPDGGRIVTAQGRLGTVRGGLDVPCGTWTVPADVDPARLSGAVVCNASDGYEVDRTWLLITTPPDATTALVLDADGEVLDAMGLEPGGSMTRTPDGAASVRLIGADGRTLDVVPVVPVPEEPFGDYGEN